MCLVHTHESHSDRVKTFPSINTFNTSKTPVTENTADRSILAIATPYAPHAEQPSAKQNPHI